MAPLPEGEVKRRAVREMFDRIAPRYDLLNRLMTARLDQRWRQRALAAARVAPGERVLDLACGTGDLSQLATARGARVVAVDFAGRMLRAARGRGPASAVGWVQGDAERLPLAAGSIDAALCGFALRNFVSLPAALAELARVVRPGGRIALLDVDRPRRAGVRALHGLYFDRVVPWVGGLVSDRDAYRYLPRSTAYLPPPSELLALLAKAGFAAPRRVELFLGTAQILLGERRPS